VSSSDSQREIDWASATAERSTLTLELSGRPSKAWSERFEAVLALLSTDNSGWGKVDLARGKIHVREVRPGAASDLRHLLDGVLRQVNSDLAPPSDAPASAGDPQQEADQELAAAFRAFAEPQEG
jgi:hypothetical protein